jgi:hypothetical protein
MIPQVPGLHEHLPEARDNVRRAPPIAKCHLSRTFGKKSIAAGPRLDRSIVDQDLQHWKPAKQLGAGFLSGLMSLDVTVDKRETARRRYARSLNVSRLNLVGQCN